MDEKQPPPPSYSEASTAPASASAPAYGGNYNTAYSAPPGDSQAAAQPPPQAQGPPPGYGYPQQSGYGGMAYAQPMQGGAYPQGYGFQQGGVVMSQPVAGGVMVSQVPDHMGLAIFTTICCCWPLGLVAIMRAQESRRALDRGDLATASRFSSEARRFSMFAIAGGCASIVFAIIIIIVVVTQNPYYY